jgi:hypothetical protein
MRKTFILIGIFALASFSAFAQKQKTQPDGEQAPTRSTKASKSTDSGSAIMAGTNLEAQLQSMVDVKKSKVGDEVILKTTKAIKQNGEVIVPKGSQLIGRITEVKQKTKDNATSKVGMVFDRIQGKNLDMPVNATIVSVAAAQVNAAAGDLFATDLSGSSSTSGRASTGRSSSGGGGGLLGGGGGGGLLGGVGSTVGGVVNTTTSTVGQVAGTATNTVGSTVGQTTGTLGRTVNGLQISQSASGSANSSSTISAQGKNVKIEKGATFNLRLDGSVQN